VISNKHNEFGTSCSDRTRRGTRALRAALFCIVCAVVCWQSAGRADGVAVYLKDGTSYHDVEIVKRSPYSLTVRTHEGHIKFFKLPDVAEVATTSGARRPAPTESSTLGTGSHGLYAFKDANGKISLTDKPERYDADIYEPIRVPLDKVEFYRSRQRPNVVVHRESLRSGRAGGSGLDDIQEIIDFHASRNGLSQALVKAVIKAESDGDPNAKSRCGACGLMQLMPPTAAEMGVYDIFDPDQNIAGGTEYLAKMIELFNGDKKLALAAYNAGPGAVKKYRGVPPYSETRRYINRVLQFESDYSSGAPIRLASATSRPDPDYLPEISDPDKYFTITLKNGYKIRGSFYVETPDGINLWTQRKWEFVRKERIKDTT